MAGEWFGSTADFGTSKLGTLYEQLCVLPPKPIGSRAQAKATKDQTQQAAKEKQQRFLLDQELRTYPDLCSGEQAGSKEQRAHARAHAVQELENSFVAFSRKRDEDDFIRLWHKDLAPHSPHRLLSQPQPAIPTLLLSTSGSSAGDRLDLYPRFKRFLHEQPKNAYVALLQPEDVAQGPGHCFRTMLAQLSGVDEAAAEDVMGLVEWYQDETNWANTVLHVQRQQMGGQLGGAAATAAGAVLECPASRHAPAGSAAAGAAGGSSAAATAAAAGQGGSAAGSGPQAKRKGKRGARQQPGAAGLDAAAGEGAQATAQEQEGGRRQLRARKAAAAGSSGSGQGQGQPSGAAVPGPEQQQAMWEHNRRRHVIVMIEGAGRITDRAALRALLAELHGERHRLPVVLVLGLSCPPALHRAKLPSDLAGLLQRTTAELAPHPQQLNRLFEEVLLSQPGPSLLLDGDTLRQLLVQSQLLEPSLQSLLVALLEAHEQHFRHEPLAPLALAPHMFAQDEAAKAQQQQKRRRRSGCAGDGSDDESYGTARSGSDGSEEDDEEDAAVASPRCSGLSGAASGQEDEGPLDSGWLEARRERNMGTLAAVVEQMPPALVRAAAEAMAKRASPVGDAGAGTAQERAAARNGGGGRGAGKLDDRQCRAAVVQAVAEAYTQLATWKLGVRWLARVAELTGAAQQPNGARFSLPSLYCLAASPSFWQAVPGRAAPGRALIHDVIGQAAHMAGRYSVRALPQEELSHLLDELQALAEPLLRGWLASPSVLQALDDLKALQTGTDEATSSQHKPEQQQPRQQAAGPTAADVVDLASSSEDDGEEETEEARDVVGPMPGQGQLPSRRAGKGAGASGSGGAGGGPSGQLPFPSLPKRPELTPNTKGRLAAEVNALTSPVRQRLEGQGLASPSPGKALQGVCKRLEAGHISKPAPARPKATGAAAAAGTFKMPSSGQTQSKRQREELLKVATAQAGAKAAAGAGGDDAAGQGSGAPSAPRPLSLAERTAAFLGTQLAALLQACPFQMPGARAFTYQDMSAQPGTSLQKRFIASPSLALHRALTKPDESLTGLQPGLHPDQEDAVIAYQLLLGVREGMELRDWLTEFFSVCGMGHTQEVEEDEEEDEQGDDDRPMGRSRRSKRRHAPRKRKAAPKQALVLDLDADGAEERVEELACRFEQAARELEAVGLCRFSKRRRGTFVHRTYFPPEAL